MPWVIRNYYHFGKFIPFEHHASTVNFYTASIGINRNLMNDDVRKIVMQNEKIDIYNSKASSPVLMRQAAFKNIIQYPFLFIKNYFLRFFFLIKDFFSIIGWVVLIVVLFPLYYIRRKRDIEVLVLFLVYFVSIHAIFSVSLRYILPVLPVFYLLLGLGINQFISLRYRKKLITLESRLVFLFVFLPASVYLLGVTVLIREIWSLPRFIATSAKTDVYTAHRLGLEMVFDGKICEAKPNFVLALQEKPNNSQVISKIYSDLAVSEYACGQPREAESNAWRALVHNGCNINAIEMLKSLDSKKVPQPEGCI